MPVKKSDILRRSILKAKKEAVRYGADAVLLDLLRERRSHAQHILSHLLKKWELYQAMLSIRREVTGHLNTGSSHYNWDAFESALDAAYAISGNNDRVINSGHLLIALLSDRSSISCGVFELFAVTAEKAVAILSELPSDEDYYDDMRALEEYALRRNSLPEESEPEQTVAQDNDRRTKRKKVSCIEQWGYDMVEAASRGKIDPVVGRDREVERLIHILGRRRKNNPVVVGEAGVGKSAVVEGLALRINAGTVPEMLAGKRIVSLDISSLVAGTKYRGDFEERVRSLIDEASSRDDVILFIDELHTIVGAGGSNGGLDTANIFKPALARGELQLIGATTLDEYRESIENDSALERRFQPVMIEAATAEETLRILRTLKPHYEAYHHVRYSDEALAECVTLTGRYITNRNFPDKAIDAMDEAGSSVHLASWNSAPVIARFERLAERIDGYKRVAGDREQWVLASELDLRGQLLRRKISQWQDMEHHASKPYVPEVSADHIRRTVNLMTGVPIEKVSQNEQARLRGMATHLGNVVVGQTEAVSKVSKAIMRSRSGLNQGSKPIAVLMFAGPTGVGKTLLAKELSKWIFDRDDALIRIDMSEYGEKHNVSRLIGSPPGYVGHSQGGQLTEAVRRQPYSVVLFDEIEKAHNDVTNIMLQLFDEGVLTDGLGRKVDFRNTIIIMTSNVGSRTLHNDHPLGFMAARDAIHDEKQAGHYRKALEQRFAPEFINRIDDVVAFHSLTAEDMIRIVDLELASLCDRAGKIGVHIEITENARLHLASKGYESRYGVRSLRRTLLENIEEPLAEMIVDGCVAGGDTLEVDLEGEALHIVPKAC